MWSLPRCVARCVVNTGNGPEWMSMESGRPGAATPSLMARAAVAAAQAHKPKPAAALQSPVLRRRLACGGATAQRRSRSWLRLRSHRHPGLSGPTLVWDGMFSCTSLQFGPHRFGGPGETTNPSFCGLPPSPPPHSGNLPGTPRNSLGFPGTPRDWGAASAILSSIPGGGSPELPGTPFDVPGTPRNFF